MDTTFNAYWDAKVLSMVRADPTFECLDCGATFSEADADAFKAHLINSCGWPEDEADMHLEDEQELRKRARRED